MLKAFKYRIYPTHNQEHLLVQNLEECRWLYNHFLGERKAAWEKEQKSLNYHTQAVTIPQLKKERPSLEKVYSQVRQNVAVRVDLAMKAFFRRVKAGEKPGYPRFRGKGWYDSITYPQLGFSVKEDSIKLAKIGDVKASIHRPIEGEIATCTIRRSPTGKWYACFSCEVDCVPLPESNKSIGIDVGLASFATLSTGEKIENPRFFRRDEKALAKAQRKMSKCDKGTPERVKARKVVSHIHERIANRRNDFAHQWSRRIINQYGIISVEDINTNRMLHNHCLAKSISDAAWSQFMACLTYKAESAGRQFVAVNPSYTSQDCSHCGHRQKLSLDERTFSCPCCNFSIDRDHNASLNILARGLASLGIQSVEAVQL